MLRGKRAVITGGGTGFGQALSVWLAREGVEVDFCARRADDIQKTCSIITAEGGMAKGHLCDLTLPESLSQFSLKWFTEFGHLNRGDMLTSEQHRCHNEKKKFQRRV
ncbi:SDR family NAD(P)-dependent oxidoreductase [Klebsiella pneumoniae]